MLECPSLSNGPTAIALVGNAGQGKTTLWRRLAGRHTGSTVVQDAGVELCCAQVSDGRQTFCLLDTPGVDGLSANSKDDLLVWDLLLDPNVGSIGLVVGGRDLRRGILTALKLTEFEKPLVLDINGMDEARQAGIGVDRKGLEEILGIQVVETVATEGEGVRALGKALTSARVPRRPLEYAPEIERGIRQISELILDPSVPKRAVATRLLEFPELVEEVIGERWGPEAAGRCEAAIRSIQRRFTRPVGVVVAEARNRLAEAILEAVVVHAPPRGLPLADRLGTWARHPVTGIPLALVVVAAMYLFVGKVGAEWLVGVVEGGLFQDRLVPWVAEKLAPVPWDVVSDAIVGEFGLLSVGLTLPIGIVMPVLVTFFLAFNLLEDSGYLARLSILSDRVLRKIGLGGRGLFPLVMGFSCITMAILTTRVLSTRKERIIATLLLTLGLPCAPLLSVMLVVLAPMPWTAPVFVFGVILLQILLVGYVASRILPGERSEFIFTIPPMRIPKIGATLIKTARRSWWFVAEAVPFFLIATFCLFVLDKLGGLALIERAARPVVHGLLVLPQQAVDVFIMTLIRREAGAGLLSQLDAAGTFTHLEAVITLLVMTFFSPCVNALLVMFKERGLRAGLAILGFVTPYAVLAGAALHWVLRSLGVTFS